jgi:type I restriction enzyme S subunit
VNARIGWKALTADEYEPEGYVFLSTPNIKREDIDFENVNHISEFRYLESPELQLRVGDVLLVKDGNTLGITNYVKQLPVEATVNGSIAVLRPFGIEARFLRFVLASDLVQGMIAAFRAGMGVPHLFQADIKRFPLPLPPLQVQRAIADYLDTETARIDALIEKKRRMVQLLEEKWNAFLGSCLSSAPGLPLKYLLRAPLAYGVLVPEHDLEGVPMLRIMDLAPTGVDVTNVARIPKALSAQYRRTIVEPGDLVVSVVGTLGRSIEITPALAGCNLNRALARVQLRSTVPRSLVRYWFGSEPFQVMARLATSSDSAQPTLGLGDLKNFEVGIPADPTDWQTLTTHLERSRLRTHGFIVRLQRQLVLLVERRQALITAAVTGELEIPGAAA